jgi:AraC-like DNA-binding protein
VSRTRQFDRPAPRQITTLAWDYPAGWQVAEHHHESHQLVHARAGAMTVHAGDGSWVVPPLWAIWVPAGVVHAIDMHGDVAMRTLYLARRLAPGLPRRCQVVAVTPLLAALIERAIERGTLDGRRAADRRLIGVVLDELRGRPASPTYLPRPRDPRADRVARALLADPSDPRTLAALGRAAGASPRTLQRLFERETGMTFARWRQQLRLLHALRHLAAGATVTAAALEVGYDSPSAFVAAFRRVLGVTPKRFLG